MGPGAGHGSTFGGNPMAAAAGNVVLDTMTPAFLEQVAEKGRRLREGIAAPTAMAILAAAVSALTL